MKKFLKKTIWISLIFFYFFQIEIVQAIVPYYYFPTKKNLQEAGADLILNTIDEIKNINFDLF